MQPLRGVPSGVATGVGSLPFTDPAEAARVVAGELPEFPHLPELPGRGPAAGMIGRAASLLVDLAVDLQPAGWRLVDAPGVDLRRARSLLGHDLDALEETLQGYSGPLKVQVAGPWTLAASVELPRGGPVLGDPGATRDLAASLREGVRAHLDDVRRRLPAVDLVLQVDEPSLPAVLAGQVPTASGFSRVDPVDSGLARARLAELVDDCAAAGVPVVVHCCAPGIPVGLLREAGVRGVSLDATLPAVTSGALDEALGEAVEAGVVLMLGLVPAASAGGLSEPAASVLPDADTVARQARRLWRGVGFAASRLPSAVTLTPTCGLAGASPAAARAALGAARAAMRRLADDPEV